MFSQASVILLGGGVCPEVDWGVSARGCIPACTGADPPPRLGRHPRTDTPLGRHSTWADTPPPTANAADGTHTTGMHSCLLIQIQFRRIYIDRSGFQFWSRFRSYVVGSECGDLNLTPCSVNSSTLYNVAIWFAVRIRSGIGVWIWQCK